MRARELFVLYTMPLPTSLVSQWVKHVQTSEWLAAAILRGVLVRVLAWAVAIVAAVQGELMVMIPAIVLGVVVLAPARVARGAFVREQLTGMPDDSRSQ